MRVNFSVLTNLDGDDIYVNPLLVSYFQSHGPHGDKERLTRIVFDEGNAILVNGSPSNIERELNVKEN
jgi:hypothetical protein